MNTWRFDDVSAPGPGGIVAGDRIWCVVIVRNEIPPAFVEWSEP